MGDINLAVSESPLSVLSPASSEFNTISCYTYTRSQDESYFPPAIQFFIEHNKFLDV